MCGLCHGLVQFLIAHDRRDVFRFAPLQGETAATVLQRYGKDPRDLNTVYVVQNFNTPSERLWDRGRGVLLALQQLGGVWRLCALLTIVPTFLLNGGYSAVARVRYRVFGKLAACPVPAPAQRAKFLA